MKLAPFLSSVFFAAATFAAPRPENVLVERRNFTIAARADNIISTNIAGAVLTAPSGKTFNGVNGVFEAPTLAAGGASAVSVSVGIDGLTNHVIQTGIEVTLMADGSVTYQAWYQWFPSPLMYFTDDEFTVQEGDTLLISLMITSAGTTATAELLNQRTFQFASKEFYSPSEEDDAVGSDAQWVIEQPADFALANFGSIEITSCTATTAGDNVPLPINGAQGITLQQGSDPPKAVGIVTESSGSVTILYQPEGRRLGDRRVDHM